MHIARLLVVFAVACTPAERPIGETEWTLDLGQILFDVRGRVAPDGQLVIVAAGVVTAIDADGHVRWSRMYSASVMDLALDSDGSVAVLLGDGFSARALAIDRFGPDGKLQHSLTFPKAVASGPASLAIDARGVLWLVFDAIGTSDLGGGPIGSESLRQPHWGQFDRSGSYVSSGVVPGFGLPNSPAAAALPGGGIALRDGLGGLFALGANGEVLWTIAGTRGKPIGEFVAHDDGDVTLVRDTLHRPELVRLDATRAERWRRALPCDTNLTLALLADGSVIGFGHDGLPGAQDLRCLIRSDADGDIDRELFDDTVLGLARGTSTGYRLLLGGGTTDLHDRTVELPFGSIASRRL